MAMTHVSTTTRNITKHHVGDMVAPLGEQFPKGVVAAELPGNNVVVKWPAGYHTRHHSRELRRIA